MEFALGVLLAGLPLISIEALSRKFIVAPEVSRKLVHVSSSIAVMLLTLFLSLHSIALVAAIFCIVLAASRKARLWNSLYKVRRKSWGEVSFPLGVLAASLLATDTQMFLCAIAVMGFADTAAAIFGTKLGKAKIKYTTKTVEGSAAFACVAIAIFFMTGWTAWPIIIGGVLLATFAELVSPLGLDNVTMPTVLVLWLRMSTSLL